MNKRDQTIKNLCLSGMFLALALLFPFLTANNRELGNILCLMHLPIFVCGIVCGPLHGAVVGITAPLLRSFMVGMPPFPAVAVPMAAELAVYGALVGVFCALFPKKTVWLYPNLLLSMVLGRIVSVVTKYFLYSLGKTEFTLSMVLQMNFITTLPGVMLQLALIPALIFVLKKRGVMRFGN